MLSIVMPAHNEEGYLEPAVKAVVTGLRERGGDFEIVVVENGSTDATGEQADALAIAFAEVKAIRSVEADYGAALKAGFLACHGDVVVNFDVDLVDLGFMDRALEQMKERPIAVLVGSKRSPGSDDRRAPTRKLITAVFAAVLRYGFGLHISDTHGLKALRREPLLGLVAECQFGRDIFDTELILRAERAGLLVEEIPVVVAEMRPARTPITRRIPATLSGLIRLRLALGRSGR
jgi:glycosyltransferase involved in cell wall biosynthesis